MKMRQKFNASIGTLDPSPTDVPFEGCDPSAVIAGGNRVHLSQRPAYAYKAYDFRSLSVRAPITGVCISPIQCYLQPPFPFEFWEPYIFRRSIHTFDLRHSTVRVIAPSFRPREFPRMTYLPFGTRLRKIDIAQSPS